MLIVTGTLFTSVPVCLYWETKLNIIPVHFSQVYRYKKQFPAIPVHILKVYRFEKNKKCTGRVKSVPVFKKYNGLTHVYGLVMNFQIFSTQCIIIYQNVSE
jgi:hypothetical protein